jgi:ATP-dependent DNA helicase RecG
VNLDDLRRLVARGESETLEFKRSTGELTTGIRTVCAMLNGGQGGDVLFGVRDDGRLTGQLITPETIESVANALRRIEPRAEVRVTTVPIGEDREVIVVQAPPSAATHTHERVPYERIGNTTGPMPLELYRQRLVEEALLTTAWESRPAEGCTLADLDEGEIILTVEEAIRRQRLVDPGTRDLEHLLLGLGLLEEGRIRNAAMILFGREERLRGRYPQCLLRMARFRGTTRISFDDNRQIMGNAFAVYRAAQRFWIDHLPVAGRIVPGQLARIDEPLYPTEALREAVANALCHRDYTLAGDSIGIAIDDDRLEIASPGPLPFGLTPEDLTRPHPSRRRNPLIAEIFYRRGLIEQWGRGTLMMLELCRTAGLPEPVFASDRLATTVTFRHGRPLATLRPIRTLTPLQEELLAILRAHGPLALGQITTLLTREAAPRTIQDNLRKLREWRLVEVTGERRWARWSARSGGSLSSGVEEGGPRNL